MTNSIEVYAIQIPATPDPSTCAVWMNSVSLDRRRKIAKYMYREDALRSLCAEILLRWVLVNKRKVSPDRILISANQYGKPCLVKVPLHFNISHSGQWCVVVVDDAPIGVDVEHMRHIEPEMIAKRYFTETEFAVLMEKNKEERVHHFYRLWTVKESYIKADGRGLLIPLNSFTSCFKSDQIHFMPAYSFNARDLTMDYALAICSRKKSFQCRINMVNEEDISSWLLKP